MKRDPLGKLNDWLDRELGGGLIWIAERGLALLVLALVIVVAIIAARSLA
jgi:hypothetical protein